MKLVFNILFTKNTFSQKRSARMMKELRDALDAAMEEVGEKDRTISKLNDEMEALKWYRLIF